MSDTPIVGRITFEARTDLGRRLLRLREEIGESLTAEQIAAVGCDNCTRLRAEVERLRGALKKIRDLRPATNPPGGYASGVADGLRSVAHMARDALEDR